MPESKVVLDEQGRPIKIIKEERLASHKLIEEFMKLSEMDVTATDLLEYKNALLALKDNATIVLWQHCVTEAR